MNDSTMDTPVEATCEDAQTAGSVAEEAIREMTPEEAKAAQEKLARATTEAPVEV